MEEIIISEFIVGACQLLPKSCAAVSYRQFLPIPHIDDEPTQYSIFCGSSLEFYIRPLHQCINDIDQLKFFCCELVFIGDIPQLPTDMKYLADTIKCYKIEPYLKYPSFVRLRRLGNLNYNWKQKSYVFTQTTIPNDYAMCMMNDFDHNIDFNRHDANKFYTISTKVKGPSISVQYEPQYMWIDCVQSMWCPQWPKEALNWSKRPRNYGWPTIDTISEAVEQGCHVVYVQHRACRDYKLQWRLSFSVAEVILLQSWTKIQQIVYHLLRFFSERKLITKGCSKEDEVLCTYHIKTLMLWTCEDMSPERWSSSSVIAICREMLRMLSEWLRKKYCPNYFVPEANLFHDSFNSVPLEKTVKQLDDLHKSGKLCHWFLEYYIQPIIYEFRNILKIEKPFALVDCMLRLIEYRNANISKSVDFLFYRGYIYSHSTTSASIKLRFRSGLSKCLMDACLKRNIDSLFLKIMSILPTMESDWCFTRYETALYSLYMSNELDQGSMTWDSDIFVEFLRTGIFLQPKVVICEYHKFPIPKTAEASRLQFFKAQDFMENLTGINSPSEFQLLSLMSKELLRKVLQSEDSQSSGMASAALVYLAALNFATPEYQAVIDLCSAVLVDQAKHFEHESLNAGCLFFLDDVVRIVGFWLLYNKFNENIHYIKKRIHLDLRLTPKVFANYLMVMYTERTSKQLGFNPNNFSTTKFPVDQFFFALTLRKLCLSTISKRRLRRRVYDRTDTPTANATFNSNPLIVKQKLTDTLMDYAIENMEEFYALIYKDFGMKCNTADCYRALNLYKKRQYDEVMLLCERILHAPELEKDLQELVFPNVLIMPPLDLFFDRDVQFLLGFHTLCYYLSPLNDELKALDFNFKSTFEHWFAQFVYHKKHKLPECLNSFIYNYSIRRHYFIGRHFLARYLKLRCRIDCSHPCTQAMAEFAAMKCNLPFEHMIRGFLLHRRFEDLKS